MADNTDLTTIPYDPHEAGQTLAAACYAAGVSVAFGALSEEAKAMWWDAQAAKYADAAAFISGYRLEELGTAQSEFYASGDFLFGDEIRYSQESECRVETEAGAGSLRIYDISQRTYNGLNYSILASVTADNEEIRNVTVGAVNWSLTGSTVEACRAVGSWTVTRNSESSFLVSAECQILFHWRRNGNLIEDHSSVHRWSKLVDMGSDIRSGPVSVRITLRRAGAGGEEPTYLIFTARAGLSGGHWSPQQGSAVSHPAGREEVPSYGSGGYGGHGGGGGAGASTVVLYEFDSEEADSVIQQAQTRGHGYGSGGGAGGRGGDGCILLFW